MKRLRDFLTCVTKPFFAWAAAIHAPWTHKKVTGVVYYELHQYLKPGSVFVTRILGDLTTMYIPGFWTHAAIYTPKPGLKIDELVTEAEAPGVIQDNLVNFLMTKDFVAVLDPILPADKKDKIMARAAEIAAGLLGAPYDYEFTSWEDDSVEFYCSKVVWYSYDKACQEFGVPSLFEPSNDLSEPTVSPQSIADDRIGFKVLFKSEGAKI